MVRRSTVDRSPQPPMYEADYEAGTAELAPGESSKRRPSGTGWRGRSAGTAVPPSDPTGLKARATHSGGRAFFHLYR